jgi:hypothetical protein
MDSLTTCSACGGFLPATAAACPHCDARPSRRRRLAVLLGLAGSASLGLTMMACYGGPAMCGGSAGYCPDNPDASGDATEPDGGVN